MSSHKKSVVAIESVKNSAEGEKVSSNVNARRKTVVDDGVTENDGVVAPVEITDSPAKIEREIPNDLKEFPTPETFNTIDKNMETVVNDIKLLLETRKNEFTNLGEARGKMPLIPDLYRFEQYKNIRKTYIEGITKVEMPYRKPESSELIQQEIDTFWKVTDEYSGEKMFPLIYSFYKERSQRLLHENMLIVSRWNRFCRTSFDITSNFELFQKRQKLLALEFHDSINRLERLNDIKEDLNQKKRKQDAAAEAERIEAERRGVAVLNQTIFMQASSQGTGKGDTKMEGAGIFGTQELKDGSEFNVGDLSIYLRWAIRECKVQRDIDMYISRCKTIPHSDRLSILKDYKIASLIGCGDTISDSAEYFDGLNAFIPKIPVKTAKIEDFLIEYDLLVAHWKVETAINQEDGRPFAYEVDLKYFTNFVEQSYEFNLEPYANIVSNSNSNENSEGSNMRFSGNTGLDSFVSSLASLSGYSTKSSQKITTKFPKLIAADWINSIKILPEYDLVQDQYRKKLSSLKELDMELRLDLDLLYSSDHEYVGTQLKDIAKRLWLKSAEKDNTKPLSVKISIIPQQREYKPADTSNIRLPNTFNYGMNLPEVDDEEINVRILESKKKDYGALLKQNEDHRKFEQELLQADPNHIVDYSNIVHINISTIFAEHEVYAYCQLRIIKIREFRVTMLRQFNFLRSIEKRLNLDAKLFREDVADPTASFISKLWRHTEFMNMITGMSSNKEDEISQGTNVKIFETNEDIRSVYNGNIQVADGKGIPFVYDVALNDLRAFDDEMLKILTVYINGSRANTYASPEYLDQLRFRTANRRNNTGNYTCLNPEVDRSQMIMEFYEMHIKYQYSKIQLINAYMEMYENVIGMKETKQIAGLITNAVHSKPLIDLEADYFSQSYVQATKALELKARLVIECTKHIISVERAWNNTYAPNDDTENSEKAEPRNNSPSSDEFIRRPNSALKFGLPRYRISGNDSVQTVTMHHPEISVQLSEVVPGVSKIVRILKINRLICSELIEMVGSMLMEDEKLNKNILDCVVYKWMLKHWQSLSLYNFKPPDRVQNLIGNIDSDPVLYNPFLPDMILDTFYVPYDQAEEGTYKSLGVQLYKPTCFDDPSFQLLGCEIIQRALKVLILRQRLVNVWFECETWRLSYESQFAEMGLRKSNFTGNLGPLNFDVASSSVKETTDPEDVEEELNTVEEIFDDSNLDLAEDSNWSLGPLAISELDENATNYFDFSNLSMITESMRPEGIVRLEQALRVQVIDKNWFMSAAELQDLVLFEIHCRRFADFSLYDSPMTPKSLNPAEKPSDMQATQNEVEYKSLVATIAGKKKLLRRIILSEYTRESKSYIEDGISQENMERAIKNFKSDLVNWYASNLSEVVLEDCQKTEFAKLINEMRRHITSAPYGKLLFLISAFKSNADYFNRIDDATQSNAYFHRQTVHTQEMKVGDSQSTYEKLSRLWYIPHLTEILVALRPHERVRKSVVFNFSNKIFKISNVYKKSTHVNAQIFEIYKMICTFGVFLQDNPRYAVSTKKLREADFIVTVINQLKREIQTQGEVADFDRVANTLKMKWSFWYLKMKHIMSLLIHCLEMNLMPGDAEIIAKHYSKCVNYNALFLEELKPTIYMKPLKPTKTYFQISRTFIPDTFVLSGISAPAKRFCHLVVVTIEEAAEGHLQSIQYDGSEADISKSMLEFVVRNIKLLALRREYLKILTCNQAIRDEKSRIDLYRQFKIKIVVPSIRQYFKSGGRGGARVDTLLSDDIISKTNHGILTRAARNAFERCVMLVLHTELSRHYTIGLLKEARAYAESLVQERLGKLFKDGDVNAPSALEKSEYAFILTEQDYSAKSDMFNVLLSDLHKANTDYIHNLRDPALASGQAASAANDVDKSSNHLSANTKNTVMPASKQGTENTEFDHKKVFVCRKEKMAEAIMKFSTSLNRWKSDRVSEQDQFLASIYAHMLQTIKNCEKIILFQAHEKRNMSLNHKRDARLAAHEIALESFLELSSISVELNELRKNRKIDEKKIRNKILDEYDSLVQELVNEIGVLQNRFHEYQLGNLTEVMNIMSEAKKEQLVVVTNNEELPDGLRDAAAAILSHEDEIAQLRDQNHELKMTVLKIRSMFSMKEQAHRCSYGRQIRKLTDSNKESEEKLWDSYRDAESRERVLRKQLTKLLKQNQILEFKNDVLQKQVSEEQSKIRPPSSKKPNQPEKTQKQRRLTLANAELKSEKLTELEGRLKRYEGIDIDNLIQELANKTSTLEAMIQEKRDSEKLKSIASYSNVAPKAHVKSSRWNISRSPSPTSSPEIPATPSLHAAAAEADTRNVQSSIELNDMVYEKVHGLMKENKALRRKLFLNGIPLPPESRNLTGVRTGYDTPRFDSAFGTSVCNTNAPTPSRSRPRTAIDHQSTPNRSRPRTAIYRPTTSSISRPTTAINRQASGRKQARPRGISPRPDEVIIADDMHRNRTPEPEISLLPLIDQGQNSTAKQVGFAPSLPSQSAILDRQRSAAAPIRSAMRGSTDRPFTAPSKHK